MGSDAYISEDIKFGKFVPYFLPIIKNHADTIDEENPRDFLDQMIIESRRNPELGWVR